MPNRRIRLTRREMESIMTNLRREIDEQASLITCEQPACKEALMRPLSTSGFESPAAVRAPANAGGVSFPPKHISGEDSASERRRKREVELQEEEAAIHCLLQDQGFRQIEERNAVSPQPLRAMVRTSCLATELTQVQAIRVFSSSPQQVQKVEMPSSSSPSASSSFNHKQQDADALQAVWDSLEVIPTSSLLKAACTPQSRWDFHCFSRLICVSRTCDYWLVRWILLLHFAAYEKEETQQQKQQQQKCCMQNLAAANAPHFPLFLNRTDSSLPTTLLTFRSF
ncbi:hypothetical protein Efla_001006 [Eimeria flavescens]